MRSTPEGEERQLLRDIRQKIPRDVQTIGQVLSRLMTRRGYANIQTANEWAEVWGKAAGSLAARTRVGRMNGGVLEIVVDSSATLQELTFRKRQLVTSIIKLVPDWKLKDLKFKVGQID